MSRLPENESPEDEFPEDEFPEGEFPEGEFKDVIAELRRTSPEPPSVHWGAYRAELCEKLERGGSRGWAWWNWPLRPFQMAVAASFVTVLVYIGLPGHGQIPNDPGIMENSILASGLDVIADLDVVQKLDLLEDLDVIERLDSLPTRNEG
jgi:hypothetical protein